MCLQFFRILLLYQSAGKLYYCFSWYNRFCPLASVAWNKTVYVKRGINFRRKIRLFFIKREYFINPCFFYLSFVGSSNSLQKLSEKNKLDEIILNAEELKKLGLINNVKKPVKILGNGEFKVKVQLEVSAFSNSAKDKIEAAGGSIKKI